MTTMAETGLVAALPALSPSPLQLQNPVSSKNNKNNNYLWWGFAVGTVTLSIGIFIYFCIRRKKVCRNRWWQRSKLHGKLDAKEMKLRRFRLEELIKATNNFSKECLVGSGAFGNVYKGTFYGEKTLAIKKAHDSSYTNTEEFRNEVRLLSKVQHNNLVSLVGFCEESGERGEKILVYEYVPNGSLLDYIMGREGRSLTWRERVKIAIGVAKGIAHLHEGINPSIIHRDLKPSNILIGENFEAKVSDFGLVKSGPTGDQSHVSSQIKGTPGYLDPAYCSSFHLSPFSDVYSFGVILLQLVAARPAVDSGRSRPSYHIIEWARPSLECGNVEEIVDSNLLLEPCNMEMMLKMGQLGLRCVVKVPKQRPTMTQVLQELESALYSTDNIFQKQLLEGHWRSIGKFRKSTNHKTLEYEYDHSQSFVSIDGVGLQKFQVEMDSLSLHSSSLRCFETSSSSISIDVNKLRGINEEVSVEEYVNISIPRD